MSSGTNLGAAGPLESASWGKLTEKPTLTIGMHTWLGVSIWRFPPFWMCACSLMSLGGVLAVEGIDNPWACILCGSLPES